MKTNFKLEGEIFENEVAAIYRDLGAEVKQNVNINGLQVDVFAVFQAPDGSTIRTGVECKNTFRPLGVADCADACSHLSGLGTEVDKRVVVSRNGFTQDAKSQCEKRQTEYFTLEELKSRLFSPSAYLRNLESGGFSDQFKELVQHNAFVALSASQGDGKLLPSVVDYFDLWLDGAGQFLTLFGDYGSGKTTTMQYLVSRLAHDRLKTGIGRVPIWIELRQFGANVTVRSFLTELLIHGGDINLRSFSLFEKLNREGNFVLVFDGFDEMHGGVERSMVRRRLEEIQSYALQKSKVILTCRTSFFRADQDYASGLPDSPLNQLLHKHRTFGAIYLNGMSPGQQRQYVAAFLKTSWTAFMRKVESVRNLSALAERPILLHMMVTTLKTVENAAFSNVTQLYELYTSIWLARDEWRCELTKEDRISISEVLAFDLMATQQHGIHFAELEKRLPHYLGRTFSSQTLVQYGQEVRTCTFLKRDSLGIYSFAHRSFQEFFCALYMLRSLRDGKCAVFSTALSIETVDFMAEFVRNHQSEWLPLIRDEFRRSSESSYPFGSEVKSILVCILASCGDTLMGAQLSGVNLPLGARLCGVDLSAADCRNMRGEKVDFTGACLRNASLKGAQITSSVFHKADLGAADFSGGFFSGCSFISADLREANFEYASLTEVVLSPDDAAKAKRRLLVEHIEKNVFSLRDLHGIGHFISSLRKGVRMPKPRRSDGGRQSSHDGAKLFIEAWRAIGEWNSDCNIMELRGCLLRFREQVRIRLDSWFKSMSERLASLRNESELAAKNGLSANDHERASKRERERHVLKEEERFLSVTAEYVQAAIDDIIRSIDGLKSTSSLSPNQITRVESGSYHNAKGLTDAQVNWLNDNGASLKVSRIFQADQRTLKAATD